MAANLFATRLSLFGFGAEMPAKMRFVVQRLGKSAEAIFFRFDAPSGQFGIEREVSYTIEVVSDPCRFGGTRRYLRCPLVRGSEACGRRAGKLFLPPGGRYFGCRTCYNLTYQSVQQHDQRVDKISRLPCAELARMLKLPFSLHTFLVLKGVQKKRETLLRKLQRSNTSRGEWI
jgi:hypothetical protein